MLLKWLRIRSRQRGTKGLEAQASFKGDEWLNRRNKIGAAKRWESLVKAENVRV